MKKGKLFELKIMNLVESKGIKCFHDKIIPKPPSVSSSNKTVQIDNYFIHNGVCYICECKERNNGYDNGFLFYQNGLMYCSDKPAHVMVRQVHKQKAFLSRSSLIPSDMEIKTLIITNASIKVQVEHRLKDVPVYQYKDIIVCNIDYFEKFLDILKSIEVSVKNVWHPRHTNQ